MAFTGIPHAAAQFYADLEQDNTREFWAAHQERYQSLVRGPMTAMLADLTEEFGAPTVFRPYHNLRFSADRTPYKTHQGGFVKVAPRTGWYVEVSADGLRVGAGCYHLDSAALAAYRAAVDSPAGAELARIVSGLAADGWEIGGEQLRTAPRGWSREHERIDLLRHKALHALRWVEDGDVVTTPRLLDEVRQDWRRLRPLVEWLGCVVPAQAARS